MLDIGTATGQPLYSIIDSFKDAKVVGIDIDKSYVPACQKLFKNHSNVTIKLMNFYDLDTEFANTYFDTIIFGSSFMLMPDQSKAIELAKSINFLYIRTPVKERKNLLLVDTLRWKDFIQSIHGGHQALVEIPNNSGFWKSHLQIRFWKFPWRKGTEMHCKIKVLRQLLFKILQILYVLSKSHRLIIYVTLFVELPEIKFKYNILKWRVLWKYRYYNIINLDLY